MQMNHAVFTLFYRGVLKNSFLASVYFPCKTEIIKLSNLIMEF